MQNHTDDGVTTHREKTTVLLYGLGAIGGFYAFILSRNDDVALSVVARSNYEAVKHKGLLLKSENHGQHVVRPVNVFKSCSEATRQYDFIVCAHKATEQTAAVENLRPAVGDETTICIMQNGVGNEEPFREAYPGTTIISGVVWVGAAQAQAGIVTHTASEHTEVGLFDRPSADGRVEQDRLARFCQLMRRGGTSIAAVEDIQVKRWEKVVWNIAWNPITTLTMIDTQSWLHKSSAEAIPATRRLFSDAMQVAHRCGVELDRGLIDELLGRINAMPGIFTSMSDDARDGRPLELDAIVGYPMRKADEFGLEVPTLRMVYALLKAVNYRLVETEERRRRRRKEAA